MSLFIYILLLIIKFMNKSLLYIIFIFVIVCILHIVFYNFLFVDPLYYFIMDDTGIIYNLSFSFNYYDAVQSMNNYTELKNNNNDSLNCYNSFKSGVKSRLL